MHSLRTIHAPQRSAATYGYYLALAGTLAFLVAACVVDRHMGVPAGVDASPWF